MTNTGGRGMFEAATDARNQALDWGARKFNDNFSKATPPVTTKVTKDDVDLVDGIVFLKSDPKQTLKLSDVVQFKATSIVGVSNYLQPTNWEQVAVAAHAAEVEVDTVTGTIKITRYVAAHDVGKAINPFSIRQQVEGGVVMSIGAVLTEELLVDKATGLPLNPNLLDYRPLSIKDAPLAQVIIVEKAKAYGTFGAHGMGEPPMGPAAPAIVNAVYNAVGVWITDMPLTRDKLLAALKGS
jgi:xanthine dehydrogenase molybdenum-binding subunit